MPLPAGPGLCSAMRSPLLVQQCGVGASPPSRCRCRCVVSSVRPAHPVPSLVCVGVSVCMCVCEWWSYRDGWMSTRRYVQVGGVSTAITSGLITPMQQQPQQPQPMDDTSHTMICTALPSTNRGGEAAAHVTIDTRHQQQRIQSVGVGWRGAASSEGMGRQRCDDDADGGGPVTERSRW